MIDAEVSKSDFWKKKIRKAIETRDADKDGFISRKDFELVVERYKKLTNCTQEKFEALSNMTMMTCNATGLVDDNVKISYSDFEKQEIAILSEKNNKDFFKRMFVCLDADDKGVISLKEWEAHNAALGIPSEHAQISFEAMDSDGDGQVTMEEFLQYHFEYFCTAENKLNSSILYGPL